MVPTAAADMTTSATWAERFIAASSVGHARRVERAAGERGETEPDRRRNLALGDAAWQVVHRNADDEMDDELDDQRDHAPHRAIEQVLRMRDRARHRQREAEQAQAERDGGTRH